MIKAKALLEFYYNNKYVKVGDEIMLSKEEYEKLKHLVAILEYHSEVEVQESESKVNKRTKAYAE